MAKWRITVQVETDAPESEMHEVVDTMTAQLEALDDGTLESGKTYDWRLTACQIEEVEPERR